MNINNLFFHIHYCNHRQANEDWKFSKKITRKIRHHELFFVSGGKGYIDIEHKRYPLKKGMLFYFYPGLLHSIETDLYEPICFMSVHFSFTHVDFNDNKWNITSKNEMLPLQAVQELIDYYPIKNTFRKLIENWNVKIPGYEFISRAILQQMLFEIFENVKKQTPNYSASLKVKKIIKYMHKNINKKLTLTELSELVHLSLTYLSRIFNLFIAWIPHPL